LVGTRGTLKQAGLLGFVVTFTHTFTVFLLGLGMLFFQQYVVAEKIVPVLGAISGLSIVGIGLMLLYQRAAALLHGGAGHSHSHDGYFHTHDHDHDLPPSYFEGEAYALTGNLGARPAPTRIGELMAAEASQTRGGSISCGDAHGAIAPQADAENRNHMDGLVHRHGGTTHSHAIEGEVTPGSLIALGVSGGLVPCPSALVLMLSAIALGHPGLGLVLLVGFSSGLALVLMAFGMLAIYARHMLPNSEETMARPIFRLIPVFSAVVVICLGLVMTAVSAGWILPLRFLS
jgi:nickel/cobalt transporter (NicO) family protein